MPTSTSCCWMLLGDSSLHESFRNLHRLWRIQRATFWGVPKWRTKLVLQIHGGGHEIWTKLCTIRSQDCQELREGCTSQLTGTILASPFTLSSKPSTCQHNVAQKRHSESCQRCHGNGYGRCTTGWKVGGRTGALSALPLFHSSSFMSSAALKVRIWLPLHVILQVTRPMHQQSGKLPTLHGADSAAVCYVIGWQVRAVQEGPAQISDPEIWVASSWHSIARSVLFHGVWLWSQSDLWLWFPLPRRENQSGKGYSSITPVFSGSSSNTSIIIVIIDSTTTHSGGGSSSSSWGAQIISNLKGMPHGCVLSPLLFLTDLLATFSIS